MTARNLRQALSAALLVVAGLAGPCPAARADEALEPRRRPPTSSQVDPAKPSSGWAVLPVVTYAPETQLGLGVFGVHFFRVGDSSPDTRPSSLAAVGLYTWRNQLITELIPELYWDDMRSHVWSRIDYRRYPNFLWAIGNDAPASSKEGFTEDRVRWQARFDRAIAGPLRIEGKVEVASMRLDDVEPGGLIARRQVPGATGGRSLGLGPGILWDTRDHLLVPRHGELVEVAFMEYLPMLGSDYRYGELLVDARRYLPIASSHALALQGFVQAQLGNPPFYELAQLGGQNLLRGYFEGRLRNTSLVALQAEYRLPLFWRFSAVAHAALGQVAKSPLDLGERAPRWSVGTGLRLRINTDEQLNLRADLGVCEEGYGLYVAVGEAY